MLELWLLECRIQERFVVKLELHAALGQAVERGACVRRRLLQRDEPPSICGTRDSSSMNRAIQASIAGDSVGRIHSGPEGFTSHRSDSTITPGPGTGIASDGVIQPALPADARAPHRCPLEHGDLGTAARQGLGDAQARPLRPRPRSPAPRSRSQRALQRESRRERIGRIQQVLAHAGDPGPTADLGHDRRHRSRARLLDAGGR